MRRFLLIFVLIAGALPCCLGSSIYVPGDYLSIQGAINASNNGDTIWVADGQYDGPGNTDLETLGKAITIRSENGYENCFIDGENANPGFHIHQGETTSTKIRGFTFRNCFSTTNGAAFLIETSSSCAVWECYFQDCYSQSVGGAIYNDANNTIIKDCVFYSNTAGASGGAIGTRGTTDIVNCQFIANTTMNNSDNNGGALSLIGNIDVFNCLFVANNAYSKGGAIFVQFNNPISITNCTFYANTSNYNSGEALYAQNSSINVLNSIFHLHNSDPIVYVNNQPTVTYSNVDLASGVYPGVGNINEDPLFHLSGDRECLLSQIESGQGSNSPCLNAGDDIAGNTCYSVYATCLDTETTRSDGVPDMELVDMGYHYPTDILPMTPTPVPTNTPTSTPTATPTEVPDPCGPAQTPFVELEEDVEDWPLTGWDIVFEGVDGNWTNNFNVGEPNLAGGDGYCLVAGARYTNTFVTTTCLSPGFSLMDFSNAVLDFVVSYDDEATNSDFFKVQFSGTGGAPFTTILEWDEDHSPYGPGEFVRLDLSDFAGLYDDCAIRFLYSSPIGSTSRVMVDQIRLTCCYGSNCIHDGDANQDSNITAGDAQLAFNIVLGSYTPTTEEECSADCNGDGTVTAADAQAIFLKVLGSGSCADD